MARATLLLVCVTLSACAHAADPSEVEHWTRWPQEDLEQATKIGVGARLAARASQLVGLRSLEAVSAAVPDDCSGLVRHVYALEGIDLLASTTGQSRNASEAIWMAARAVEAVEDRRPAPGDLLFFRHTYDRNRNGRLDDGLTHVAIVESVDVGGTVTFIHRAGQGVVRSRMNLARPHERTSESGGVINEFLRPRARRWGPAFASQLYAGTASAARLEVGLRQR